MDAINVSDFDNLYANKLEPELIKIEEERKKIMADCKKMMFFCALWFILYLIAPIFITIILVILVVVIFLCIAFIAVKTQSYVLADIFDHYDPINSIPFSFIFSFVSVSCIIFAIIYFFKLAKRVEGIKNLKNKLKIDIYTKIFALLGMRYKKNVSANIINYQKAYAKYLSKFCNYTYEDYFCGVYKKIPFEIFDIKIKTDERVFSGLLLAVRINKNFEKETVVKTNNFDMFKIKKENVKLEDIEFPKYFKVYSDDQIEARYIFTPSFMERLKNYHKSKNSKTIIFFNNSISTISNMFILTSTGRDSFEIPFQKCILNKRFYYNLINELTTMLEIAVALKLEQNIGL